MKISNNVCLKDLEGKDIAETSIGKTIARILSNDKSSDPLRSFLLAKDFYTKDEVELNSADQKFVADAVKATVQFTPLAIGQILELLK